MFDDTVSLMRFVIDSAWSFFSICFPGTSFTFGSILISLLIISISLMIFRALFGVGGGDYRSCSTDNPKISDERRYDDK